VGVTRARKAFTYDSGTIYLDERNDEDGRAAEIVSDEARACGETSAIIDSISRLHRSRRVIVSRRVRRGVRQNNDDDSDYERRIPLEGNLEGPPALR
jgi:hypothetical protein